MKGRNITKLQTGTIVAIIVYLIWEYFVQQWSKTLPDGDPVIRVDLLLIIPVITGLLIASIVQTIKRKKMDCDNVTMP
jgi:hypothetical protein